MTGNNRTTLMLLAFFFISLALVLSASAEPIEENVPPKSFLLDNPSWAIVVVTVDAPSKQNPDFTKKGFFVNEVLRGKLKKDYVHLRWQLGGSKPRSLQAGDKLILFVLPNRDKSIKDIDAEITEVYKFSNANRETILNNMAPPERNSSIQLPLFLMILSIPIILKIIKRHGILSIVLICLQFISYSIYESGISRHSNIRIDLLLVYPALLSSIVILLSGRAKQQPGQ
jgi:hypothetical protein